MFKKINSEEFDQLKIKGWGRSSPVYNAVISLKVGDAMMIEKTQWKRKKKTPSGVCRGIEKKFRERKVKYKCVTLADGSGWAIKRLT